jgi:FkbM family methyltransferase
LKNKKINKIYSFEPNIFLFRNLLKKFGLNKRVILSNNALGENTAIKKLFLSNLTYNSSMSEFNKNSKYLKFKNLILNENVNQSFSKVKQITFDQYFKSRKIKNSFLKIDVEGYEYNVLRGARYKIKDVKYILIENQFSNQYKNDFNKIKKLLNKNNFKLIKNFLLSVTTL